ncbi:FAEL082Wp [Eremothecium gossypii FDAG1]|nr:FAEL082Wp [Eremothecium gossypii FDAG1]
MASEQSTKPAHGGLRLATYARQLCHVWRRKFGMHTLVLAGLSMLASTAFLLVYNRVYEGAQHGLFRSRVDVEVPTNIWQYADEALPDRRTFVEEILRTVQAYPPGAALQVQADCLLERVRATDERKFGSLTASKLQGCVDLSGDAFAHAKEQHALMMKVIQKSLPEHLSDLDHYPYISDGIVILGGGHKTIAAIPAIRSIRENSGITVRNSMPIEVVIPGPADEEKVFCSKILPVLDPSGLTRCVHLGDTISSSLLSKVKPSDHRTLALLASSFSRVLYLDSSVQVINAIDGYFHHELFNERGLVLWPDYWRRLHHPKLYELAGSKVDTGRRERYSIDKGSPIELYGGKDGEWPMHDCKDSIPDASSSSGVLLIDKKKHFKTLALALYYNVHGEPFFYPLLDPKAPREAEKDTIVFAAHVLSRGGGPLYHQVTTPKRSEGHRKDKASSKPILEDTVDTSTIITSTYRHGAASYHDFFADHNFELLAGEIINSNFDSRRLAYVKWWRQNHSDDTTYKDKSDEDLSNDASVKADFYTSFHGNYTLAEYLNFFEFTPVSFVETDVLTCNPWIVAQSRDLTFDGASAVGAQPANQQTQYKAGPPTHHRLFSDHFQKLTTYDLELATWSAYAEFLCSKFSYKDYPYLKEHLGLTDSPTTAYKMMCKYISARVSHLQSTSWHTMGNK